MSRVDFVHVTTGRRMWLYADAVIGVLVSENGHTNIIISGGMLPVASSEQEALAKIDEAKAKIGPSNIPREEQPDGIPKRTRNKSKRNS